MCSNSTTATHTPIYVVIDTVARRHTNRSDLYSHSSDITSTPVHMAAFRDVAAALSSAHILHFGFHYFTKVNKPIELHYALTKQKG